MTKIRAKLSDKNEYYISPHAFYTAYHFALRYGEWLEEYETMAASGIKGINYGRDSGGGSHIGDPTSALGMKLSVISRNLTLIQSAAREAGQDLYPYILQGVTVEGVTYKYLRTKRIPCSRNEYYARRRKFYYLLSKKIENGDSGDN